MLDLLYANFHTDEPMSKTLKIFDGEFQDSIMTRITYKQMMFTTSMCWWQIRPRHPPDPRGGRFHITSSYWESLLDGCWSGLSKLRCCKILKIITYISFNLWIHHQFVFWATCLFVEVTNRLLGVSVNGQVSRGSFPTAPDKVRKNETLMFKNNILMLKHIFAEIKFRSPTPTLQTLISIWMFEIIIEKEKYSRYF